MGMAMTEVKVPTREQVAQAWQFLAPAAHTAGQCGMYDINGRPDEPHDKWICKHVAELFTQAAAALGLRLSADEPADGLGCHSCGRPYSKGPDLVVSDENWAKIEPPEGGFLCPNCMNDAFEALGAPSGSIEAAFTSGPFANKNWKKPTADEPAAQQPQSEHAGEHIAVSLRKWAEIIPEPPSGEFFKQDLLFAAARIEALEAAAAQPSEHEKALYDIRWERSWDRNGGKLECKGLTARVVFSRLMGAIANSGPITVHSIEPAAYAPAKAEKS